MDKTHAELVSDLVQAAYETGLYVATPDTPTEQLRDAINLRRRLWAQVTQRMKDQDKEIAEWRAGR